MNQFMTINAFLLGLVATDFRLQLPLQPGRGAQGPGQSLARQYPGVGDVLAARALTTSSESRSCTMLLTNSACRESRKIICRKPSPGRPSAGPLDPVMA